MEPDVVEIAPLTFASGLRTRKPRKAMQVNSFSYNNVESHPGSSQLNLKMYQNLYDHNHITQLANDVNHAMDVDDYAMFQDLLSSKKMQTDLDVVEPWGLNLSSNGTATSSRSSLRNQASKAIGNPSFASPSVPQVIYSSATISASVVQPSTPDIVMVPATTSRVFTYGGSATSSRPIAAEVISSAQDSSNVRKIKEKFLRDFTVFDIVEEFSDHYYASKGKASKQHSKKWVKKVQEDWMILENDLPETIFVRACESRMDLLRAVIVGAEGTPYHDGLFFFDIQFPDTYPSVPPKVHYHSGGLRINPNLYNCGKVCLSLLGTWTGSSREKWLPKESTMLQLLVSIQALILNQKPYFNEPGYERSMGTQSGESHSKTYSENVFVLSLKTMVYSMRRPPEHFEEFVRSHFFVRANDIVKACNAYKDGAPVGSIVKGRVQDLEQTSQTGSKRFRTDVASFMKTVVDEFVKLGVIELEEKPKPPTESNANTESNKANQKRNRLWRLVYIAMIICFVFLGILVASKNF